MKNEGQIRTQIDEFERQYRELFNCLPPSQYKILKLESIQREIDALKWVLDELV